MPPAINITQGSVSWCVMVAVNQGGDKLYPRWDKDAHKYKSYTEAKGISKHIRDCLVFKSANEDQKKEMLKKVKSKYRVCLKCSSWSHKSEASNRKQKCSKCREVHINELCNPMKFFSFSLSNTGSCMMSLQDVPIRTP